MSRELYEKIRQDLLHNKSCWLMTTFSGQEGSVERDLQRVLFHEEPRIDMEEHSDIEFYTPKERLIILGGGHIGLSLCEMGAKLGFHLIVIDDRPSFANPLRFPMADDVICNDFKTALFQLKPRSNDYIAVVTRGHRHDEGCLRALLEQEESRYIGMIGSRRRVKALIENLVEEGLDATRLQKIHTPIGLSIGAVTPEEITIAILAEIIQVRRHPDNPYVQREFENDYLFFESLTKIENRKASLVSILETKGSVPRKKGAKMFVFEDGRILGSIGGGCTESQVTGIAMRIIGTKRYQVITVDMTGDIAEEEGMACGGVMKVLVEDFI